MIDDILILTHATSKSDIEEVNQNILEVIDKFASAGNVVGYKQSTATER